jgi:hypothetical protein
MVIDGRCDFSLFKRVAAPFKSVESANIEQGNEKRFQNVTCQPFVCHGPVRHSRIDDERTELISGSEKRYAQQRRYNCRSVIGSVGQKFENSGAHSRVA